MSSIGRNIEVAIQSMLKVSEEVADIQAQLNGIDSERNMLDTLYSVSKYIGLNPKPQIMMSFLEDSIKGVFGAKYCQVIFDKEHQHLSHSKDLCGHLDYYVLTERVKDIEIIKDVSKSSITDLEDGVLVVVRLSVGDELYGFLTCYWTLDYNLNESSLLFLQIIGNQVSMFLKSNALIEEFKALAVIDSLTGIYNRSYYTNLQENSIPEMNESIIMFDIDYFKKINDSMGHQFGDKILVNFAKTLTKVISKYNGTAFRYGGEEFIIKCAGGEEIAYKIAEDVRKSFYKETGYSVSAGVGTIGVSCKVLDYRRLVSIADDSLYVAKQMGRNRTVTSTGDIQILKKCVNPLSKVISKYYRSNTKFRLFRGISRERAVLTREQFEELNTLLAETGRIYDEVYLTDSLDFMAIISTDINEKQFIERIKNQMGDMFNEFSFEIYSLKSMMDEILLHSNRVSKMSPILAKELGVMESVVSRIQVASKWYDLGKICVDPAIYEKKDKLTVEEHEVLKLHSWFGYFIAFTQPSLCDFSEWVLFHHEDQDGHGYFAKKGIDIPIEAQILSIVDKYNALTEERCYRSAYSKDEAIRILQEEHQIFNEVVYDKFMSVTMMA